MTPQHSLYAQNPSLLRPAVLPQRTRNIHLYYRGCADIPSGARNPILRFYATGLAEVTVNGTFVAYGPGKCREPLLYYDEYPLAEFIRNGQNLFCIHLSIDSCPKEPGMLIELEYEIDGKKHFLLQSPDEWQSGVFQSYLDEAPRNSGTGYAEYVRYDSGEKDWREGQFASELATAVSGRTIPCEYLHPRAIPLFSEIERQPVSVRIEDDGSVLADFGVLYSGRAAIQATGSGTVMVEYIEDLKNGWISPKGTCVMYDDRISGVNGAFCWKAQHARAGRYLRIRNVDPDTCVIRLMEYNYPVRTLGGFHSSDPLLNRLSEIAEPTLRACMEDIFTDCPHRDREQWMDAFISSQAALSLFGVRDLTRKCILQHAAEVADGRMPSPSLAGRQVLPDYSLVFVSFVFTYYLSSGDRSLLEETAGHLKSILEGFQKYEAEDGLLQNPAEENDLIYLDNAFELKRNGKSSILNALYFRALSDYSRICSVLNETGPSAAFRTRAEKLRDAFLRVFAHPQQTDCFRDTDTPAGNGYFMVNFSCELGHWEGETGVLEFFVDAAESDPVTLEFADYCGIRISLNGNVLGNCPREGDWRRQPMYDPQSLTLPLEAGTNRIRLEVKSNSLNWEVFFRFNKPLTPHDATVSEIGLDDGTEISTPKPVRIRQWIPPVLSQTAQGYIGFSRMHADREKAGNMLRKTIREEYPRTYVSIRVPSFCVECGSDERERAEWVMPCNSPWPTFFFLDALFENGAGREALQIIRRYWKDMLENGATTTYEEWGTRSSLCHAWGAAPVALLHREILGVHLETLHTGTLLIRPCLFDLEHAQGAVAVDPERAVTVQLDRRDGSIRYRVTVPEGLEYKLDLSLLGDHPVPMPEE